MITYLLIKLASRCNYDCSYCYWFQDQSVRKLPPLIGDDVISAFVHGLARHIKQHNLREFVCSFHGGEPTLYGAERLSHVVQRIDEVGRDTNCNIRYALTTNASLIDKNWLDLIIRTKMSVTVSLDGPPAVHDSRRITIQKKGTWEPTVNGYLTLCRAGIRPSILAVCHPTAKPKLVLDHIVNDLGAVFCDFLIPDADYSNPPRYSVAPFYIEVFDEWYDKYADLGIEVRILGDFIRGLLGLQTKTDSIGYAPMQTVCLNTNGKLEPHDVLRIAGAARVETECSIFTHELSDIYSDKLWRDVRHAATDLCEECSKCIYKNACGGGHLAHRWSESRGYKNPSVYCADLKRIFAHIGKRIKTDLGGIADESYGLVTTGGIKNAP